MDKINKIFNSQFEFSLRLLILLNTIQQKLDLETISLLDVISTYGEKYKISDNNLHGNNDFYNAEFGARYYNFKNVISKLVMLKDVDFYQENSGYFYKINENGKAIIQDIETEYTNEYISNLKIIMSKTNNKLEAKIIKEMFNMR